MAKGQVPRAAALNGLSWLANACLLPPRLACRKPLLLLMSRCPWATSPSILKPARPWAL